MWPDVAELQGARRSRIRKVPHRMPLIRKVPRKPSISERAMKSPLWEEETEVLCWGAHRRDTTRDQSSPVPVECRVERSATARPQAQQNREAEGGAARPVHRGLLVRTESSEDKRLPFSARSVSVCTVHGSTVHRPQGPDGLQLHRARHRGSAWPRRSTVRKSDYLSSSE